MKLFEFLMVVVLVFAACSAVTAGKTDVATKDFSYTEVPVGNGESVLELDNWNLSGISDAGIDLGAGFGVTLVGPPDGLAPVVSFDEMPFGVDGVYDDGDIFMTTKSQFEVSEAGVYRIGVSADWYSAPSESDFFYGYIGSNVPSLPNANNLLWSNDKALGYDMISDDPSDMLSRGSFYLDAGQYDLTLHIKYDGYNDQGEFTAINMHEVFLRQVPAPSAILLAGIGTAIAGKVRRR